MDDLERPGRLVAGLGLLVSLGLGLMVMGLLGEVDVQEVVQRRAVQSGVEFIRIQGGAFCMGSEKDDPRAYPDEWPAHNVRVADFWMPTTEITNAQYGKMAPDHPDADKPVVRVAWYQARDFCRSFEEAEGWVVDLPTEAEWEYAARAGTSTPWSFGDREEDLDQYAWFGEGLDAEAHEVAKLEANSWGLYDMHGNVWEWVVDCFGDYPEATSPIPDPGLQSDNCQQSDTTSAVRVLRGGAYWIRSWDVRSAYRFRRGPVSRGVDVGFRCVRRPGLQP